MNKKVVWLPYDFDTAIGINNEGSLTFSYNLEDTDHLSSGADIYNGQQSVMWCNLRDAFSDELKAMYKQLRSDGVLSYEVVEKMFEEHQAKWPEAIFNEDAYYKYLQPLIDDNDASYLTMLQGSKADQRKWWLYNRFRYLDSKYNAGDALTDVITLRGYDLGDITVIPYADIYPTIKYGSYLVQKRGSKGEECILENPLDAVTDTEIYIYSASQLASVGDLSPLKVGYANFSYGTKLQSIKIGDSDESYSNGNLEDLALGNNVLLKTIDVRNCPNLAISVDLSGCTNIEEVYFDGTSITGVTLPNGGILKTLHLPETITNLTILNQKELTDLTVGGYSNIATLRLEGLPESIDIVTILYSIASGSRVRLIDFALEMEDSDAIDKFFNTLDTMRGLDEKGLNVDSAQVSGSIHTDSLTGSEIVSYNERYSDVEVTADHTSAVLSYYSYDGSMLLYTETILDGANGTYTGTPSRDSTAQYTYAFAGWSTTANGSASSSALRSVTADRSVYAAYTATVRKYTVKFYNGSTLLQTVSNVAYGSSATYTGSTPEKGEEDYEFSGWSPSPSNITGDTNCYAQYRYTGSITVKYVTGTFSGPLEISTITEVGAYAFTYCSSLTLVSLPAASYIGTHAFASCSSLTTVSLPVASYIDEYAFAYCSKLTTVSLPVASYIGISAFASCSSLTTVSLPAASYIDEYAFNRCSSLTTVSLPVASYIGNFAFNRCSSLTTVSLPVASYIGNFAFDSCPKLTTVSFPVASYIGASAFIYCSNLVSLYVLSTSCAVLSDSAVFGGTPMSLSTYLGYFGSIYVPKSLVDTYKTARNWSYYSDRITAYTGE